MDGRLVTVAGAFVAPWIGIGVTVWKFSSNPVAILGLVLVNLAGALYLLSYTESF